MTRSVVFALGLVVTCSAIPAAQSPGATTPPPQAQARHPEEGRPFIRGYQPAEVGGTSQIWSILQDRRGVLYAGGNSGVIEFDGSNWRRIKVGASATVRSLTMDASGRIYLGSADTFGYLAPDARGELQFVTLKNKLPAADQNFNDVWRAFAIDSGVYFQTEQAIFKWANDALTIIKPASRFNRLAEVDGRLYLTMPETGLNILEGDTFKPLPGTAALALEPYTVILRYDAKRLLIGTRTTGLFLYDGQTLTPFRTELDGVLTGSQLYRGTSLADGSFAFTTTSNGLVIVDRQGRAVMHLNRANGLPSDVVYYAMPDKEGAVWLALDSGLARLEVPSPASFFDPQEGLPSQPFDMARVDGRLYAAVQTGVLYLSPSGPGGETPRFKSVGVSGSQCWIFGKMLQTDAGGPAALTIACSEGLFEIRGTTAHAIYAPRDGTFRAAFSLPSKKDPTRLWVGLFDGLASFRRRGGQWVNEGRVDGVTEQVRTMFEEPDGSVWAGTANDGAIRVSFASAPPADGSRPALTVKKFGVAEGIPDGGAYVFNIAGAPLLRWALKRSTRRGSTRRRGVSCTRIRLIPCRPIRWAPTPPPVSPPGRTGASTSISAAAPSSGQSARMGRGTWTTRRSRGSAAAPI